jgi:hypothetical protein
MITETGKKNVETTTIRYSWPLANAARLFSYLFHPLFIPTIATWYMAFIQPGYFTGMPQHDRVSALISVAVNTIFYPGVTVLLLKGIGFIKSIFLRTQRERIGPYIASNIFYFWIYLVLKNLPGIPFILSGYIFGVFLASSIGLIVNSFYKISMHGLAMGTLSGLMLWIVFTGPPYNIFPWAMLVFLLTGIVSTSRLIVGDHRPFDLYSGIILGILCSLIGIGFVSLS